MSVPPSARTSSLRVSVVVSSASHLEPLDAVKSVLAQDYENVECLAVSGPSKEVSKFPADLSERVVVFDASSGDNPVRALNRAFAAGTGDVLAWLDSSELLAPWACRIAAHVFQSLPQFEWLTSAAEYIWSPSQLMIAGGLGDGYSSASFYAGRNLKSSPYYSHPIWRAGTFWKRSLWDKSGGAVRANLTHAGDYELWTRFFEHAELAALHLPIAGRRADCNASDEAYWSAAAEWHGSHPSKTPPPSRTKLKRFLIGRNRKLARRWGSPSYRITIAAPTEEVYAHERFIF